MAIRGKTGAPAESAATSFESGFGGPAFGQAPLRIPRERLPWTYLASPTQLMCLDGKIVAQLAKAPWTPGLGGNGRDAGRGEGAIATLEAEGWQRIPHSIECVAFGVKRPIAANESAYLDKYEGQIGSKMGVYWSDAWHRPRQIGHLTRWEFDAEGWADFLARCLAFVHPGALEPIQIQIATEPVLRRLARESGRETLPSQQAAASCIKNLPPDLVPAQYRGA